MTQPYYIEVIHKLKRMIETNENETEVVRSLYSMHGVIKIVLNMILGEEMGDHSDTEFGKQLEKQIIAILCPELEELFYEDNSFNISTNETFNNHLGVETMGILINCS